MIRVFYLTRAKLSLRRAHTRNVVRTAAALAGVSGFSVHIVTTDITLCPRDVLDEHGVMHGLSPDSFILTRSFLRCLYTRRNEFDVLYARDPKLYGILLIARYVLRKKIIFEFHGNKEWKLLVPLWRACFRVSHGAIFITHALSRWYGGERTPSAAVHMNAPDLDRYPNRREALQFREQIGLPLGARLLMYAGSGLWNRVSVLTAMLPMLPKDVVLVFVGLKDDELAREKDRATALGVRNGAVVGVSRVDPVDVPKYLVAADVLLIPPGSIAYEGSMASKIFEYLPSGVPIVSHVHGANREVLTHNVNALLVETDNPVDFARAVERLLADGALAERIVTQARRDADVYTWERRGREIADVIRKVTKEHATVFSAV